MEQSRSILRDEENLESEELEGASLDTQILQGHISAFYAFDVGYEISLEKLTTLLSSVPAQPMSPKKQTPMFTQYTRPPHIVHLGRTPCPFGGSAELRATLFDFGVVSMAYTWTLGKELPTLLSELPTISQSLYQLNLVGNAREQVRSLVDRIKPAISKPNLSSIVEDYYLFVIERLGKSLRADELLTKYRSVLAQTLRFETASLSVEQQDDALRQKLSYYEKDLLLIDWNAAVVYDQDYDDAVNVLELLNVELLEARYIDTELDRRIQEHANLAQGAMSWPIPLRTPLRKAMQELGELRIESSLLSERLGNSLKLIGDLYLARVYSSGAERFYLKQWQKIISDKLDTIDSFYELVTDRIRTAQSQTLELAVIVLIMVELFLALFKH
ncbi:MAG TPA: hypothetical protein VKM94_19530 [Blastocatellia bacterium]|nr:hypothetical protein [Blastocatellia bacterium]